MKLIYLLLIIALSSCCASHIQKAKTSFVPDYLNDYAQFKGHLLILPVYEIQIVDLPTANGKATKDGDKWIIHIDTEFDKEFHLKPQMKRLIYHELSHILLWKLDTENKGDVMNPELVYLPMKQNEIARLFSNEN